MIGQICSPNTNEWDDSQTNLRVCISAIGYARAACDPGLAEQVRRGRALRWVRPRVAPMRPHPGRWRAGGADYESGRVSDSAVGIGAGVDDANLAVGRDDFGFK